MNEKIDSALEELLELLRKCAASCTDPEELAEITNAILSIARYFSP